MNNCNCNGQCGVNNSKTMYSADYDSLIESLTHTRDEIDALIKTLEARKYKDKTINDILSSEYEEDQEQQEKTVVIDSELKRILEDILNDNPVIQRNTTAIKYPYTYTYPWF